MVSGFVGGHRQLIVPQCGWPTVFLARNWNMKRLGVMMPCPHENSVATVALFQIELDAVALFFFTLSLLKR